uniref:Uncharacterized protein n=1 Tax=Caenorhabditis japonica TaxID=281687 RepID=A0A8R1HX33_CAEJA
MSSRPSTSSDFGPAPALFLELPSRNFGARWFGQRGFGGLLEDPRNESEWIPQYNLQHFWKRKIAPTPIGLVEPLIPPRFRSPDNFDRLPGHFSYKTQEYELYNRNLLATNFGNSAKNGGILKIWTVNERSKRHYLEGFQVEISKKGQPIPQTTTRSLDKKIKMVPPIKSENSENPRRSEPLLELRASFWSSPNHTKLFLRSPTLLQSLEIPDDVDGISNEQQEQVPIFHTAVKNFQESPLLEGVLAVVDFGGRIWLLESTYDITKARKIYGKFDTVYQNLCFTDHPKLLTISDNFCVEIVDSRMNCAGVELWKTPEFACRGVKEPLYVQQTPPAPPIIRHVAKVPNSANNFLAMTDYSMVLLDDRFPGKTVLEMRHAISSGAHKFLVAESSVRDAVDGGEIFSIFSLEQLPTLSSSVSMTKIYRHASGIFSAVDAFHSLGEPHHFNDVTRRGKYTDGTRILAEPTRAISLVETPFDNLLLFRQTDDGAIWWQKLSHEAEISEESIVKKERKSAERIAERMRNAEEEEEEDWRREKWRPVYSDGMHEQVKESQRDRRSIIHIEIADIDRKIISKCAQRARNAHRKAAQLHTEEICKRLEVVELDDENSTLSKITLDTWTASIAKMEEAAQNL